jgi:hypothetical protein
MAEGNSSKSSTLLCQVKKADANHRMDEATNLLRSKHFPSPCKVVYLGNVANTIISLLEHPETPTFTTPPSYNEQKWALETTSGQLKISIRSVSYWGLGLFNSSYLNIIKLEGPMNLRSRLIYDLVSSLPDKPWEFKHLSSAKRWMRKEFADIDEKVNQNNWQELVKYSNNRFIEVLELMKQTKEKVSKKVNLTDSNQYWNCERAKVSIASADFDLDLARGALADGNAPAIERAIARIEASLIEADPETGVHDSPIETNDLTKEIIVISDIGVTEDKVIEANVNTINQIDSISQEEVLPLIDLTTKTEEE